MQEDILNKIREKRREAQPIIEEYNNRARIENELAKQERAKKELGLPYIEGLGRPIQDEDDVIMEIYKGYRREIEEDDTNNIFVYIGTYKSLSPSFNQVEAGAPFEELVDRDDPEADFRVYNNLEGIWSYRFSIPESLEFERTHTVLFPNFFEDALEDFVLTSVKDSQEKAVSLVLERYKK